MVELEIEGLASFMIEAEDSANLTLAPLSLRSRTVGAVV
jgi:hypothetical protein